MPYDSNKESLVLMVQSWGGTVRKHKWQNIWVLQCLFYKLTSFTNLKFYTRPLLVCWWEKWKTTTALYQNVEYYKMPKLNMRQINNILKLKLSNSPKISQVLSYPQDVSFTFTLHENKPGMREKLFHFHNIGKHTVNTILGFSWFLVWWFLNGQKFSTSVLWRNIKEESNS